MKKIVSMLLASCVAASAVVPVWAKDTFSDVKGNYAWAYEYVEDMAEKGLISGYEDGTYRPGNSVSRKEAFALFARLMGSNNEINKDTLELAKEKYESVLSKYELSYAMGDVAYMLYRGVISENELDTYFAGNKHAQAMPRYEAAILITKAMLSEKAAKAEVLIDMEYTDVSAIPKEARQYVYYVSQKGIMSGMGNGEFSPETAVLRGQVAVMLSKTASAANYFFESAKLEEVDTVSNNIKISDYDEKIGYADDTVFYKNGVVATDSVLTEGQNVVLTYSDFDGGVKLVFADIISAEVDDTKLCVFKKYASAGGNLMISAMDPQTGITSTYTCSSNVIVTLDGEVSDINKLRDGDYVSIGMSSGKVVEITTQNKNETIKGAVLEEITPAGTIRISHEDEKYDGQTFILSNDVVITKNGDTDEFSSLYRGDSLTIRLEYGLIASLSASSKKSTMQGVIKSYTISSNPTLTIRSNGNDYVYDIPAEVKITIDGKEAKLADFEIGSNVKVSIESDVVKEIEAASGAGTTTGSSLTGVVTNVNVSAKVIMVTNQAGEDVYITCKDSTNFLVVPTLGQYSIKQIKTGDSVVAYGAYQNGIFVCTGMTVTPTVD